MNEELFFAVRTIGLSKQKLKPSNLMSAARHNLREIQAELGAFGHIKPTHTKLNESLAGFGTAADIVAHAHGLMLAAGVDTAKLRRDHVQAIECLFSLRLDHCLDERQYFSACLTWVQNRFGADNILSAVIHRDENAPHCHILIMPPIANGKLCGSELVTRPATAAMREAFSREVARRFGLNAGESIAGERKVQAVAMVLDKLSASHDPVLNSTLWPDIRAQVERDPTPFMARLGLLPRTRELKTMAQIFTSTGKGPQRETRSPSHVGAASKAPHFDSGEPELNPIGFEQGRPSADEADSTGSIAPQTAPENTQKNGTEKHQTLSCVGFDANPSDQQAVPPSSSHGGLKGSKFARQSQRVQRCSWPRGAKQWFSAAGMQPAAHPANAIRLRDDAARAGDWCSDKGEFRTYGGP